MNAQTDLVSGSRLSQRLKTETVQQHERMHELMAQGNPFADLGSYARFVAAQYLFQRDVEYLFHDAAVKKAVPDLEARGREEASLADLADLGAAVPQSALASEGVGMPEALGWLYVSEGSTLGAAFLFKEARERLGLSETFGARNLAAYPQGRAMAWRAFVASLDAPVLSDTATQDRVIAGANAAYDRFGSLLEQHFPSPAESRVAGLSEAHEAAL
ncbi:biliverdin-producing heme oxygenase [Comamonas aquatilis]|uniref:biliverdin-producing heme oxygenase n=1 Tax=Comamonas aquatilis TaxID=1778406 RepID=UPI0039EEBCA1